MNSVSIRATIVANGHYNSAMAQLAKATSAAEFHAAFAKLAEAAAADHADANFQLALRNFRLTPEEAFLFALRAAQLGHTEAMHLVATMYTKGRGTETSTTAARRWHHAAARNGHQLSKLALQQLIALAA